MARVLAVANQKGGVAKTTSVASLGAALSELGRRVQLTINGLTAADEVVIPLQCETLSHRGVGQLLDTVADVQKLTNPRLLVRGVLPTLFDGRAAHSRAVIRDVASRYQVMVLDPPIARSVRFAEAPGAGRSILTTAGRAKGAEAYRIHARAIAGLPTPPPAQGRGPDPAVTGAAV